MAYHRARRSPRMYPGEGFLHPGKKRFAYSPLILILHGASHALSCNTGSSPIGSTNKINEMVALGDLERPS